ncbi:MAG: hypothetical protein U0Y82_11045 [Thermoleophilia bacterium]
MRRAWSPDRLIAAPGYEGRMLQISAANWDGDPDDPAIPRRRLTVLCCMDCRLDPLAALHLELGDAHVFRNAGGRVTPEALTALERSQRVFGTVGGIHPGAHRPPVPAGAGRPGAQRRGGHGGGGRSVPYRKGVGGAVADLAAASSPR